MTAPVLTVRPGTEADTPTILALIRDLAEYEKLLHEVVVTEADLRRDLFGPRPWAETLIGEVNGGAAGFALFFPTYSTFAGSPCLYLEDLFVRPAFRKLGLGRRLLQAVAEVAVDRGCARYEWSVLDWNTSAIAFYESVGARMSPDWRRMRMEGASLKRFGSGPVGG